MYNYELIISIFSNEENLEEIIREVQARDNFTHVIKSYNAIDKDTLQSSDIVVIDMPEYDKKILSNIDQKKTKVILCVDEFNDDCKQVDEVIIKPYSEQYLKYVFNHLLDTIALEEELNYTNNCLLTTIDGIPDMFWIKSIDGIHTLLNKEFCNMVGKSREDVTGKDHYYIWDVSKDDPNSGADICKKTEDQVIAAGHTLCFQETVKSQKGTRQLVTYKSPLYDKLGRVIGTIGFGHDITDLKNISVENQIFLNSVPSAILLRDNEGIIQNVNNKFEKYFNMSKDEVIGTNYDDWKDKTFISVRQENESNFLEGRVKVNKKEKIVEILFDDIRDVFDNVTGQLCIFRDVTVERKLEEEIIRNSNMDFITKLYNRRYLDKYISEQSEGSVLTLISVDLDHFKSVNDTYGHKVGDDAIILTAKILKECFSEDLVVRMGGDEFLVVKVGNSDIPQIKKEAQNLLDTLSKEFKESEYFNKLSASVGISQGVLTNEGIDELLHQSDTALYHAKQQGRACYVIYEK